MQITRSSVETAAGPSDWFTGSVYIDPVATPTGPSRLQASSVHFTPGARTAWHTHPNGQTIYVTDGVGLAQRRGEPIERVAAGIAPDGVRRRRARRQGRNHGFGVVVGAGHQEIFRQRLHVFRDFTGAFGCVSLSVVEIGRNRDNRPRNSATQSILCICFELL